MKNTYGKSCLAENGLGRREKGTKEEEGEISKLHASCVAERMQVEGEAVNWLLEPDLTGRAFVRIAQMCDHRNLWSTPRANCATWRRRGCSGIRPKLGTARSQLCYPTIRSSRTLRDLRTAPALIDKRGMQDLDNRDRTGQNMIDCWMKPLTMGGSLVAAGDSAPFGLGFVSTVDSERCQWHGFRQMDCI